MLGDYEKLIVADFLTDKWEEFLQGCLDRGMTEADADAILEELLIPNP